MKFNFLTTLAAFLLLMYSCKNADTKLPSGYDFIVVTEGEGETPKVNDYVTFSVKISGDDGKLIQEMKDDQMPTIQIPAEFGKGANANPVIELLAVAKVGGVYKIQMPIDSIPNAPDDFKKMKYIEYEIGIKSVRNEEDNKKYMEQQQIEMQAKVAESMGKIPAIEELVKTTIADFKSNKLETKTTPSGLKYYIMKEGEGAKAENGNSVKVNYYGSLMDGTMFDNSFRRGSSFPFTLGVGQVIPGWDEGIALMNKGSKAFLFIPYNLAYGEAGSPPTIPAKSDLVFYVELEDISGQK